MMHPKFRVSSWIDTSDEAMDQPQATILYGIQTQPEQNGSWINLAKGSELMFFKTPSDADAACKILRGEKQAAMA